MNNKLKEFEELLLGNILLKVHNQTLGDKNPKWNEWRANCLGVHRRANSGLYGASLFG
jgi:hypothetical protein